MLDSGDLSEAFNNCDWMQERQYLGLMGYVSSQWRRVFSEQRGRGISGTIRKFDEEAEADFIRLRMILRCHAKETMQCAVAERDNPSCCCA
jgi:hypothetical protein